MRKFVIILSLKILPHLKCVATLPCEMSSVFIATIENKTTSVTTRFKRNLQGTTCLLSQLLSSNCHILQDGSSAGILHGCLRQDGAPSHTARNTPRYLRRENIKFIKPHMWPLTARTWIQSITLFGVPLTDGLSTSTIRDNHSAEAGNHHWVGQTIAAFHRSRH